MGFPQFVLRRAVQSGTDHEGRAVQEALLVAIGELNAQLAPSEIGPIAAVVGPTHMVRALDLVALLGLHLAPGVGMQGASANDVAQLFADCPERVMSSASRSLLVDGLSRLRDTAARLMSSGECSGAPPITRSGEFLDAAQPAKFHGHHAAGICAREFPATPPPTGGRCASESPKGRAARTRQRLCQAHSGTSSTPSWIFPCPPTAHPVAIQGGHTR